MYQAVVLGIDFTVRTRWSRDLIAAIFDCQISRDENYNKYNIK